MASEQPNPEKDRLKPEDEELKLETTSFIQANQSSTNDPGSPNNSSPTKNSGSPENDGSAQKTVKNDNTPPVVVSGSSSNTGSPEDGGKGPKKENNADPVCYSEGDKKNKNKENNQHRNTNSSKGDGVLKKAEKKRNAGADVDSCNNPDESKELNEAVDQEKQPVSNRSSTNDSPSNTGSHEGGEERTEDGNNADPDKDPNTGSHEGGEEGAEVGDYADPDKDSNPSSTNDSSSNTGSHEGGEEGAEVGDNADPDKDSNPSSTNDFLSKNGSPEGGEEGAENRSNVDPDKDSDADDKQSNEQSMETLRRSISEHIGEITNLKEAIENLKEDCVKKDNTVKEKDADISSYLNVIEEKNKKIELAEESERSMKKEHETLKRDFTEKDRDVQSMEKYIKDLNKELKTIKDKNLALEEYSKDVIKKHITLADEVSILTSQKLEVQREVCNLKEVEKRLHKDIEHQCLSISDQRTKLEKLNDKLNQEKEKHDKIIQKHKDDLKAEKNKLKLEKYEHEKTIKNYEDNMKAEKKKANKEKEEWQIERTRLENRIKYLNFELTKMNRACENTVIENSRLHAQLDQQRQNNSKLETEKEELLLRLSKIAGAKLTYNNPNIADLSDEKRPTKLAEEFSELYDNEWTDAFEMVDGNDDEQKTSILYTILQHANEYCGNLSSGHDEAIEKSFVTLEYVRQFSDRDPADSDIPETNGPNHGPKKSSVVQTDQQEVPESQKPASSQEMNTTMAIHEVTQPCGNDKNASHVKSENEEMKKSNKQTDIENSADAMLATEEDGQCTEISNAQNNQNFDKSEDDSVTTTNGIGDESEQPGAQGGKSIYSKNQGKYNDSTTESDAKEETQILNTVDQINEENCKSEKKVEHVKIADCAGNEHGILKAEADNKSENNHGSQHAIDGDKSDTEKSVSTKINAIDKDDNAENNKKSETFGDGENAVASDGNNKPSENLKTGKDDEQSSVVSDIGRKEDDGKSIFGEDGSSETGEPNKENEGGKRTDNYEQSDGKTAKTKDTGNDKKDNNVYVSGTIKHKLVSKLDFKLDEFTTEQKKTIMDMKKTCEVMQTNDVIKVGTKKIADEMNIKPELDEVMKYISKCIEICWSMYRHAPPVHINFCTDLVGACLDKNVYRPYTKSGKHIKFVVWPAVYLHEGGPLLGKGVAQGRD